MQINKIKINLNPNGKGLVLEVKISNQLWPQLITAPAPQVLKDLINIKTLLKYKEQCTKIRKT